MAKTTRREHLKRSTLAVSTTFIPAYLAMPQSKDDRLPPSKRINLACVGVGGRAQGVIPGLCRGGVAEPVALCDVDLARAKKNLEQFPKAKRFTDFRVMLDKVANDVDAVSVVVPDHSHFCAAITAMSLGKHVYVEKPLTRTFEESEILMRAEKKFGVVTQMGNQGHTGQGIDTFAKMVKLGLCRGMNKLEAWKSPGLWFMEAGKRPKLPLSVDPIPDSLADYDYWVGPRRKLPYNDLFHPFNWRGFYEFGMGMLGDWGAHIIDYAHDKLDMGLPTEIKALRIDDPNQVYFPLTSHLSMHFPARGDGLPAMDVTWRDGADHKPDVPKRFWSENNEGKLTPPPMRGAGTLLYSDDSDLAIMRGSHGSIPFVVPNEQRKALAEKLKLDRDRDNANHYRSFINACMGEGQTNSPFSIAGKLSQVLALGTIAQYLNTDLTFDPATKKFKGNDAANALLNPPARKGWEEFYKMA